MSTVTTIRFRRHEMDDWEYGFGIENHGVIVDKNGKVVDEIWDATAVFHRGTFILHDK